MLCFCTLQPRNSHQEGLDPSLYAVILVPQEMYPRLLCCSTYYNRLCVEKQRQRLGCVADNPERPPVTLYIYLTGSSYTFFLILLLSIPSPVPRMWEQVLYPELPGILAYVRTTKPCSSSSALRSPPMTYTVPIRLSSSCFHAFHSIWRVYHP